MEDIKDSLFAIIFVIIVFLGITLGFRVGSFIEDFPTSGAFTSWRLLNSPVKFTEIVDINPDGIWAQTTEGKLYFGLLCYEQVEICDSQWKETTSIPSNAHDNDYWPTMEKGKTCQKDVQGYPKKLPGEIVECVIKSFPEGGRGQSTYVALLKDGTLWQWYQFHPNNDVPIVALIIGPFIGLVLGVIAGVRFLRLRKK